MYVVVAIISVSIPWKTPEQRSRQSLVLDWIYFLPQAHALCVHTFFGTYQLDQIMLCTLSPPEGVSISRLPLNNAHPDSSTPRQIGEVPNASQQKDFSHSRNVKRLALTLPTTSCPGTKGYLPWEPPTTKVSEWHTPHAFGAKKRELQSINM